MTILVGVLCKDGVVIGADGSATFAAGQIRTIEQQTKKIEIIADRVIVAGTGQIGLGQRFFSVLQQHWEKGHFKGQSVDFTREMCRLGVQDFASTQAPMGQFGALVAFPSANKLNLCEFSAQDFQPELKTEKLWYVSMGSAQLIVDPFLGLMRKIFWTEGAPHYQDAIFAVMWALQHAIELNPGGVNEPIQIAVLAKQANGELKARLLSPDELIEHRGNVEAAHTYLRKYADILRGQGQQAAPDIPQL